MSDTPNLWEKTVYRNADRSRLTNSRSTAIRKKAADHHPAAAGSPAEKPAGHQTE